MIRKLTLHHFRNLESTELEFGAGITVVCGKNGQGKTNLLEAIHWVTQGWSFRARKFDAATLWNAEEAWLRMEGSAHGRSHQQALLWRSGDLQVKVNGTESRSLSDLHGAVYAVMLGPEDIALVREGPEHRRRWLDLMLCQRNPENLDLLQRYRRILAQRNRWLKDHKAPSASPTEEEWPVLETLTEQIADLGAAVMVRREALLAELEGEVSSYYTQLSNGAESIQLNYKGSVNLDTQAELKGKLLRKMKAMRSMELAQGVTVAGPHKDDITIVFQESGMPLREAGSQGQCRCTALAMGLVALDVAIGIDAEPPILLLDDIFAELDADRRRAFAECIKAKNCQVFVATPRLEDLPFAADHVLHVECGRVQSSKS